MPIGPVFAWSKEDKIIETIKRSEPYFGPAMWQQVQALISPENIAIMLGTLLIWAASHFIGVGEIVDVILLLVGAVMLGPAIVDVAENLLKFGKCIDARSEQDLQVAAKAFADATIKGGITVIMAILLRRGAKAVEVRAVPGVANPSLMQVIEGITPKRIGLPNVGVDPQAGKWWSSYTTIGKKSMPAGTGKTSWWGQIFYSTRGAASEQEMVLFHEAVHRWLTPKLGLFRTFRVRLRAASYTRSVLLKYLEEAMAESYAQLRMNGFKGVLDGIRFPVANDYVSISQLAAEGEAIGTIVVGVQRFVVSIVNGPPEWAGEVPQPEEPLPPGRATPIRAAPIRLPEVDVSGGYAVTVTPGASLSAIAKQQYGDFTLWPLIYDLNRAKIGPNPNHIKPGTSLLLMKLTAYSQAELADARKRAPSWKHAPR
jgi:hypothetical protein